MITPIYKLAMYEIVNKIANAIPSAYYYGGSLENGDRIKLLREIFEYTDNLQDYFPEIDSDTYCMIVCATIMQSYSFELVYDFSDSFFNRLKSKFADDGTISYFVHISNAIGNIRFFHRFRPEREIIDWPDDFHFFWESNEELDDFRDELLEAIDIKPTYSYAYCLLAVPHFDSIHGVSFNYKKHSEQYRKAFVRTHKVVGDDLFNFLLNGNFKFDHLTVTELNLSGGEEKGQFINYVEAYATKQGYRIETIERIEIKDGFYTINDRRFPAGIPFFRHFEREEYIAFLDEMLAFINQEWDERLELTSPPLLADYGDARLEYKHFPLFGGMCLFMPLYDSYAHDEATYAVNKVTIDRLISMFLDVSADEIDQLEASNEQLRIANEELQRLNTSLNKHIKLNEELVRSLSHSSANYLNSERLAQTGIELHTASVGKPTVDELHFDGLLLLLQSEHETYLRRRLDSLVVRCQANGEALKRNIREGLSLDSEGTIMKPFEYAIKTIISRLVTRDDDIRSSAIKAKFTKTQADWRTLRDSFISDVLAGSQSAIQWCNENLCQIKYTMSERWENLRLIEDRPFFDLIVEIITELFFNALSHGEVNRPILLEFGQREEIERLGHLFPTWCFIKCENDVGDRYKGGKQTGLETLDATLRLISGNKRGIERYNEDGRFITKAWLEAGLLRAL